MKEYRTKDIIVHWESETCSHSAICLKKLPQVFDLNQRPWVNIDGATPEDIIRTIDECPSGALKYSLPSGSSVNPELGQGPGSLQHQDQANAPVLTIKVIANGPLVMDGPFQLLGTDGSSSHHSGKTSMCRCGLSERRPFCDGTHFRQGWKVD